MKKTKTSSADKKLIGELLVGAGLITDEQLAKALEEQEHHGGRIGFNLVKLGYLTPATLSGFLATNLGIGSVSERLPDRLKAADGLPRHLALYYKIAPLKLEENTLTVAISQIDHPNLIQALSEVTGYKIDPMIYPESEIKALIDSSYKLPSDRGVEVFSLGDNTFSVIDSAKKIKPLAINQLKNERDIGEWLRSIIAESIKEKSREILIKPEADGSSISFKKDTFFLSEFALDSSLHDDLTFLLMRLSKMSPTQQQKPQHGRFLVKVHDRKIAMVSSAFPTIYGIRFVLEMFDERVLKRSFEELTANYLDLRERLEKFMERKKPGMVLLTGPDSSGRTTFLYTLIARAKEDYREILTLEEAVRYPIAGISQTQIADGQMENSLENIVNQRPDLVVINPVRSERSAELAFLIAARCPVIAVLTSYDSYVAVDWLCRHKLKSAVKARLVDTIISPRLLPRLCPACAGPMEISPEDADTLKLDSAKLKANQGCEFCKNPDNRTSEMIFEWIAMDEAMLTCVEEDHSSRKLRERARATGRKTLFDVGLQQAMRGEIDATSALKLKPS